MVEFFFSRFSLCSSYVRGVGWAIKYDGPVANYMFYLRERGNWVSFGSTVG